MTRWTAPWITHKWIHRSAPDLPFCRIRTVEKKNIRLRGSVTARKADGFIPALFLSA